jgi:CDP-4-dehydro-6-deoxyglucose reductase, E3
MSFARITLLPSRQGLAVDRGETILDAALRAGLNLPHSCRAGHCASCRARVLEGDVTYPSERPLGLTATEAAQGYALLCQARAASTSLIIEVREIRSPLEVQIKSLPCRIERTRLLAPDVIAIFLRLPAVEEFTYLAGQYVDVMLSHDRRRSFSIANPPHDARSLELHIRRVPNGEFTESFFRDPPVRALLRIEGPLGQFWFREDSPRPALLIGGGTGYAPLRAMLRHRLERGDSRPFHLYWGARSRIDLYEHEEVLSWVARYPNFRYTPVLSQPLPQDAWGGRTGFVHAAALDDHAELEGLDIYASGPPIMIDIIRREVAARGLPSEQLFFDSFDYASAVPVEPVPEESPRP